MSCKRLHLSHKQGRNFRTIRISHMWILLHCTEGNLIRIRHKERTLNYHEIISFQPPKTIQDLTNRLLHIHGDTYIV